MKFKIIPIDSFSKTKEKILNATYSLLASDGFENISIDLIIKKTKISRKSFFTQYSTLKEVVADLSRSDIYWPTTTEILENSQKTHTNNPKDLILCYFMGLKKSLQKRPETVRIMIRELLYKYDLAQDFEITKTRSALEFFEEMEIESASPQDITNSVALIGAAISFLVMKSLTTDYFGGLSLSALEDDKVLEQSISKMLDSIIS